MTPIADMVSELLSAGIPHDAIVLAIATAERAAAAGRSTGLSPDTAAEKRRAYDRERKARQRHSTGLSTGLPPDTETPLILTPSPHTQRGEKKVRGHRKQVADIPPDWKPPERAHEIARELDVRISDIEPRFRDYLASSGRRYADYDAGFCNFVRNTPKFNGGGNGQGRPQATGNVIAATDRILERVRAFDEHPPSQGGIFDRTGAPPLRAIPKG
jgi:hypothetical protein